MSVLSEPNNIEVIFFHETTTGCRWLEHSVLTYSINGAVSAAEDYFAGHKSAAAHLLKGWRRDGEDVDMYPDFEILSCDRDQDQATTTLNRVFDAFL